MSLLKGLLFIAMSLQPWYEDQKAETHEQRGDRYATIAQGVTQTVEEVTCTGSQKTNKNCTPTWRGNPERLGYVLLTLAYQESKFARNVHAGNCGRYQCDAYKDKNGKIRHRATSLWQIQSSGLVPPKEWKMLSGLDQQSTTMAAKAAYRIFVSGYRQCGSITGGISRYAGVSRCDWPRAEFRAHFAERLLRKAKHYENNNWIRSPRNKNSEVEITDIQLGGERCLVTKQGRGLAFSCTTIGPSQKSNSDERIARAE
jgi:hypothetical protein